MANGDRTETAFGQEVEALLAGAAVTSVWHEMQRAASVHINWERERPKPLHWVPTQVRVYPTSQRLSMFYVWCRRT